ncbi:MAG: paraslipin [Desertifilum sp.]|nr:paraslipin [Desertifilum sp.]MDI9639084.1 stomatin-like protein [Geitlerinema splendidum]
MLQAFLAILALISAIGLVGSIRVIKEAHEALVERLGRYNRRLKPGLNFIVPFIETIVIEALMSERVLEVPPQQAITKDSVSLKADAVVYWQILDLRRAYYAIDNVEMGIRNLILTMLRSDIGQMNLDETFASRKEINQSLLRQLDEGTGTWGVKITRVEVRDITPAKTVIDSMELERAAEIRKRAAILDAQGSAESMEILAQALKLDPNSREFLKFLVAQRYVEANQKLGESPNSKVVFMDPKALTHAMAELIEGQPYTGESDTNGNSSHR